MPQSSDAIDEALASGEASSEGDGKYQVGTFDLAKAEVDRWRKLRAIPEARQKPLAEHGNQEGDNNSRNKDRGCITTSVRGTVDYTLRVGWLQADTGITGILVMSDQY